MKEPKGIKIIKEKISEVLQKYNIDPADLDDNGSVYYANGNDSTPFDWSCNNRLCEFMVWHKNGMGCVKVYVRRDNMMEIYVYPGGEMSPTETIKCECGFSAEYLKNIMLHEADNKNKWDKKLNEIFEY